MNKFHSWELGAADNDSCEKCGMNTQKSNGCCRDEVKVLKLQQDQVSAKAAIFQFAIPAVPVVHTSWFLAPALGHTAVQEYRINGPPLISKQDTYLNNCVFRL